MLPYIGLADALRRPAGAVQVQLSLISRRLIRLKQIFRSAWETTKGTASSRSEPKLEVLPCAEFPVLVLQDVCATSVSRIQPRFNSFLSLGPRGFHRVAYTEWGDPDSAHIIFCVHGFTRNSRDFDVLAAGLAERCRVICMDVVGRGASDWLENKEDYDFSLYQSDAAALLARVMPDVESGTDAATVVDWVGTSMGGLIGMLLAAKSNTLIRRLVLNDVGPLVPWLGLARLRRIHSQRGRFRDLDEVESHMRHVYRSFGPLSDHQWRHVARHSVQLLDDGSYVLAYDPAIMSAMRHARHGIEFGTDFLAGVDLWPVWDRVRSPTLVLRGKASDLLLRSTSERMQRRGPKTKVVEFDGIGHAPWLMTDEQNDIVRDFLLQPMI